ncbi:hypothetical protein [Glycocaulis alkaliphilus]|nr:hypothetical protein [Glycocaulis alkaliphilus]GGB75149.1 hypothetical protein GCM10007417_13720 [Glycocaulis alkaliphilus]
MKNRLLLSTVTATAVILVACGLPPVASSSSAQDGTRITGGDIRLSLNEDTDARITGADVRLDGRVGGELRVAGADITLRDMSVGSLSVTGADVSFAGAVLGDARVTGADISIRGNVGGDLRVRGADVRMEGNVAGEVDGSFADAHFNGRLGSLRANGADIRLAAGSIVDGDVRLNAAAFDSRAAIGGTLHANVRTARLGGSVAGNADIYADEGNRRRLRDTDGLVEISGELSGGTICARRVVISGTVTGPLSVRALEPVSFTGDGTAPQLDYTPRGSDRCRR